MTLNPHFPNYNKITSEQELLEDLIIEYIQVFGQEIYYLPRRRDNTNTLHHDDDLAYFDTAYPIEMYIEDVTGFGGESTFMSKFDIEVRDQIVFNIARRRFDLEIGSVENTPAPREGDLIYFPMNGKLFQILFSDNKPFFYQLGSLQMFRITCENFEFSSERFSTGIEDIDRFQLEHSQDVLDFVLKDANGNNIISGDDWYVTGAALADQIADDYSDDTDEFKDADEEDGIIDFTEANPYANRNPY